MVEEAGADALELNLSVPTGWRRGGWDSPVGRWVWLVERINTDTYNSILDYSEENTP